MPGRRRKAPCKYAAFCYFESVYRYGGFVLQAHIGKTVKDRRERSTAFGVMLFIAGMLAGIAGLVLYEVICEGIGSSEKLHDRYHE